MGRRRGAFQRRNLDAEAAASHAQLLHAAADFARQLARRQRARPGQFAGPLLVGLQRGGYLGAQRAQVGGGALHAGEFAAQCGVPGRQFAGLDPMLARQLFDGGQPLLDGLLPGGVEFQ